MSTITPHYRNIKELLQSQSFSIDEYQREYKWEEKHIVELIDDLLAKFRASYIAGHDTAAVSSYEGYFLGSIIVSKRGGKSYLIDGQQRLTSLTLLLIHLFGESKKLRPGLDSILAPLIYSDNYGSPSFNLDIPERLPVIEALFHGQPFAPDGKEESIQTMYARYRDIERQELADDLGEALPHFVYWLINRVGLIEIATDNDNYAYAIFETMNDRGKPLSPVDMLKAYLLAPVDDVGKKIANATWKRQVLELISWGGEHEPERDANCIKAWFRSQFAQTIRERKAGATDKDWELIGTIFHRWARDNVARLPWGNAKDNFTLIQRDFPFFARAYTQILDASRNYTPGLEAIYYNSHNEFTWQNTVLLAPLMPIDDEHTVRRKMAAVAIYLDIWLMRRAVNYVRVTYSSSSYAMYLLCKDIRQKNLSELIDALYQRLAADEVSFDGIASRKDRLGISDLRLNQFSRRYIFHLLARLTSFIEVGSGRPDLFDKYVDRESRNSYDIEHLWPYNHQEHSGEFASQEEFRATRDHVASLVLLPADVNRSYRDKPLSEKVTHYATQNLYAGSLSDACYVHQPRFKAFAEDHHFPFKPYATFGKAEHAERTKLVEKLVKAVWSPDRLFELAA